MSFVCQILRFWKATTTAAPVTYDCRCLQVFFFHVDFRLGESLDSGGLTVAFFFAGGTVLVDGNH